MAKTLRIGGIRLFRLCPVVRPGREDGPRFPGFHWFYGEDLDLFLGLVRGGFTIRNFRSRPLRPLLRKAGGQVSRLRKRLLLHGIVKKIARPYTTYRTAFGETVTPGARRLRDAVVLPALVPLSPA